jgi:hypothetical protein
MKSRSFEHDIEEKVYDNDNKTLDTKPKDLSKSRNCKDTFPNLR